MHQTTGKSLIQESVQFSSDPRSIGSSGGLAGRFRRDTLPVFSAGSPCEQFWHGQGFRNIDTEFTMLRLKEVGSGGGGCNLSIHTPAPVTRPPRVVCTKMSGNFLSASRASAQQSRTRFPSSG